jgi:predicted lipid-binding transport protein (Tim44 family)
MHVTAGTRWLRPLGVAVLLLASAACSNDPPPAGTVRTSTPSVQSSTPTPTATPVEQQVEAAVRAYYAELTRAAQTNDTSTLKTMLRKSCPCYRAVRVIDTGARQGETTPGAKWTLDSVRVHDITGRAAVAEVNYRVSAYDVLDKSGNVIDHIDTRSNHFDLSLVQSGTPWIVANIFDLEG